MKRKRDNKARSQKIQERQRVKRNESRRKNSKIRQESLNHRTNVFEAKKKELAELYMKELVKQFDLQHRK